MRLNETGPALALTATIWRCMAASIIEGFALCFLKKRMSEWNEYLPAFATFFDGTAAAKSCETGH